ncbi:cadherin-related family member 5 isoform X4 [Zootoca vivipara]|uniref:cadherin-related family member 5 isoform X4 n=1 Tax=Zootoca vivipara TaxID=8524 RepID=UPI00293B94FC|nr:cadherin-related family member 5 isoform X4 [Zootoca vivipara]
MALFRHSCTWVIFLLLSAIHVQAQNSDCGVQDNPVDVEENNPPGALITNITTADGVTVKINPLVMNGDQFEIQNSQLLLKNSVDYEVTTALVVELQCFRADMVVNSIIVVVNIINVNDNPPVFPETNITVNVREDTAVNTTVVPQANVTAKDADKDTIYYSLTADPPVGLEYFNTEGVNNPQIYLRRTLDYEKINYMQLVLYAMDGKAGEAPHTATATITIHVLQADRRPPWFQPCTSFGGNIMCINQGYTGTVNVSEYMNESLVLEPGPLYAIDGDRDLNEKVEYAIADGNDDTFLINKDSGEITMKKTVNTLKTFMLYVVAFQTNNPYRYSQTTVEIKVVHRNDHKPYFEKALYAGTVSVGLPVPSLVMEAGKPSVPLRIFAADDDFTDKFNPDIKYQIENSTNFTVTVDGFLLTAVVLDVASTVTLLAIANDTATLQEVSTLITVDVKPLESGTVQTVTSASSQPGTTTTHPTTGISPATDKRPTANTPSQAGTTTKHLVTGESPATDGTIGQSTTKAPQTETTKVTDTTVSSTVPTPLYNGTTTGDATRTTTLSITTSFSGTQTTSTQPEQSCLYRADDMVAVGATLGCLLLVTLVLLGLVSYKYYKLKQNGEDSESVEALINGNLEGNENPNYSGGKEDKLPASVKSEDDKPVAEKLSGTPPPLEKEESSQESAASDTNKEGAEGDGDTDSEKEVRSILTKDRRMSDDGYKAVWFKEDIDPEAKDEVLMIENDSDTEQKGNESDSDNADDQAGDNEVGDGARGGSDRSFTLGKAQLPEIDSTDDLQDTEENGVFL